MRAKDDEILWVSVLGLEVLSMFDDGSPYGVQLTEYVSFLLWQLGVGIDQRTRLMVLSALCSRSIDLIYWTAYEAHQ